MRVVIALDKFKGTLSAQQACELVAEGIKQRNPKCEILLKPMADGGDGSAQILAHALALESYRTEVPNLMGHPCIAHVYWHQHRRLAVIESAEPLGIGQAVPSEEGLLQASSRGFGLLLQKAFDLRPQEIWLLIGGTMVADCGWGLASVFGLKAYDSNNTPLRPALVNMPKISRIEWTQIPDYVRRTKIVALCDVNAPAKKAPVTLCSFLEQKGAKPESISQIAQWIELFWQKLAESPCNPPLLEEPYMGSGGGMGIGIKSAFPHVAFESGARKIAKAIALPSAIHGASLCVVGEGCLDATTLYQKTTMIVSQFAAEKNVPVCGVFGKIQGDIELFKQKLNLQQLYSIVPENAATSGNHAHALPDLLKLSKTRLPEIGSQIKLP